MRPRFLTGTGSSNGLLAQKQKIRRKTYVPCLPTTNLQAELCCGRRSASLIRRSKGPDDRFRGASPRLPKFISNASRGQVGTPLPPENGPVLEHCCVGVVWPERAISPAGRISLMYLLSIYLPHAFLFACHASLRSSTLTEEGEQRSLRFVRFAWFELIRTDAS